MAPARLKKKALPKAKLKLKSKSRPSPKALPKVSLEAQQARMHEVIRVLRRAYPEAECSLTHRNEFELLIATILSAQTTDERVNLTTPELFRQYPDAQAMAQAPIAALEKLVQSTGFYHNKARSIQECSRAIVENHDGKVPHTLEELVKLRGVGRKTANVVLGNIFGVPGLVVDTHVGRLSRRLGFTAHLDPEKVEQEMMKIVPMEDWVDYAHLLIAHGRAVCTAKKALCERCPISGLCPRIGV